MNGCIYRTATDICRKFTEGRTLSFCAGNTCPYRRESRADHIRSTTDAELAVLIAENVDCCVCRTENHADSDECPRAELGKSCAEVWLDWLREEWRQ